MEKTREDVRRLRAMIRHEQEKQVSTTVEKVMILNLHLQYLDYGYADSGRG